jgi:hypothetical protein
MILSSDDDESVVSHDEGAPESNVAFPATDDNELTIVRNGNSASKQLKFIIALCSPSSSQAQTDDEDFLGVNQTLLAREMELL